MRQQPSFPRSRSPHTHEHTHTRTRTQVLVVATLESLAWFVAFDSMNNTGVPYCCPFPRVVIFAMVRGAGRCVCWLCMSLSLCLCVCVRVHACVRKKGGRQIEVGVCQYAWPFVCLFCPPATAVDMDIQHPTSPRPQHHQPTNQPTRCASSSKRPSPGRCSSSSPLATASRGPSKWMHVGACGICRFALSG
jgi:hypothetical protein